MSNVLLGGAIGDALGVPFEKMNYDNPLIINWDEKTFLGSEHHKLLPKQFSDDTQCSLAIAQSLIESNGFNPDDLAKRYVELFTSNTIRGYGRTTKIAIDRLITGTHWSESGVLESYGNGTAMRAAPLGVYFRKDIKTLIKVSEIDAKITHNSNEAIAGSIAIALAAFYAVNQDTDHLLDKIYPYLPESKVKSSFQVIKALLNNRFIAPQTSLKILGTKADVRETVPSVLYLFLKMKDYYSAVIAAIKAGGDTDTTAAIVGALFGTKLGMKGIDSFFYSVEDFDHLIKLDNQLYHRSNKLFFPIN